MTSEKSSELSGSSSKGRDPPFKTLSSTMYKKLREMPEDLSKILEYCKTQYKYDPTSGECSMSQKILADKGEWRWTVYRNRCKVLTRGDPGLIEVPDLNLDNEICDTTDDECETALNMVREQNKIPPIPIRHHPILLHSPLLGAEHVTLSRRARRYLLERAKEPTESYMADIGFTKVPEIMKTPLEHFQRAPKHSIPYIVFTLLRYERRERFTPSRHAWLVWFELEVLRFNREAENGELAEAFISMDTVDVNGEKVRKGAEFVRNMNQLEAVYQIERDMEFFFCWKRCALLMNEVKRRKQLRDRQIAQREVTNESRMEEGLPPMYANCVTGELFNPAKHHMRQQQQGRGSAEDSMKRRKRDSSSSSSSDEDGGKDALTKNKANKRRRISSGVLTTQRANQQLADDITSSFSSSINQFKALTERTAASKAANRQVILPSGAAIKSKLPVQPPAATSALFNAILKPPMNKITPTTTLQQQQQQQQNQSHNLNPSSSSSAALTGPVNPLKNNVSLSPSLSFNSRPFSWYTLETLPTEPRENFDFLKSFEDIKILSSLCTSVLQKEKILTPPSLSLDDLTNENRPVYERLRLILSNASTSEFWMIGIIRCIADYISHASERLQFFLLRNAPCVKKIGLFFAHCCCCIPSTSMNIHAFSLPHKHFVADTLTRLLTILSSLETSAELDAPLLKESRVLSALKYLSKLHPAVVTQRLRNLSASLQETWQARIVEYDKAMLENPNIAKTATSTSTSIDSKTSTSLNVINKVYGALAARGTDVGGQRAADLLKSLQQEDKEGERKIEIKQAKVKGSAKKRNTFSSNLSNAASLYNQSLQQRQLRNQDSDFFLSADGEIMAKIGGDQKSAMLLRDIERNVRFKESTKMLFFDRNRSISEEFMDGRMDFAPISKMDYRKLPRAVAFGITPVVLAECRQDYQKGWSKLASLYVCDADSYGSFSDSVKNFLKNMNSMKPKVVSSASLTVEEPVRKRPATISYHDEIIWFTPLFYVELCLIYTVIPPIKYDRYNSRANQDVSTKIEEILQRETSADRSYDHSKTQRVPMKIKVNENVKKL
eukprot:GDKJ01022604.1.p1 GENE.GDKJ01022604.1~~GDKJ01022604.1.p1  ORF type:complete len:1066 (-),score=278.38 GDKJ01022604.1:50-3247(-)